MSNSDQDVLFSRFTACPEKAVFISSFFLAFFFAVSRRNGFQPVKSLYFWVDQQKKELLEKNRYFRICKPANCPATSLEFAERMNKRTREVEL